MNRTGRRLPAAARPQLPAAASGADLTENSAKLQSGPDWRPHLLALAFYSLLTLLVAWPVVVNLGAGTPGHFPVDRNQNLWNLWWFKRSVLETQTNPFSTDFLYYPYGAKLYLHTFSPYNLLLGLPLQLAFGLTAAFSLLTLLTFPLGGYAAWLLARYLTGSMWGGLLAGLVWSFGPYHWVELRQEQINLLSLQWIPLCIYFLLRLEKAATRPEIIVNTLAAAGFYLLNLLVDYYYALYLLMFAGLYWLWQAGAAAWSRLKRKLAAGTIKKVAALTLKWMAAFSLALLVYSPVLLATVRETASPRYVPLENTSNEQVHSADLLQLFLPPAHHPWWGQKFGLWKALGVSQGEGGPNLHNFGAVLGYVAVALSLYALWRQPGRWFWAFNALFWLVISFGPSLRFNGASTGWPMPYRAMLNIPFFGIGRFPERFVLMAQLSFAVLGAWGLARLLEKIPQPGWRGLPVRRLAAVGALALFFLESWPGVLPPPDHLNPPRYAEAVRAGQPGLPPLAGPALLELPVTKHSNADSPRMFNQIYHQRPILGGYISRDQVDLYRFGPPAPSPLYDFLDLRGFEPDILPPHAPAEWLGLLNYQRIGLVALYETDFENRAVRQRAGQMLEAIFGPGSSPYYADDTVKIWTVPPGGRLDRPLLVLGWGWYERERTGSGGFQRWLNLNHNAAGKVTRGEAQVIVAVGPDTPLNAGYSLEFEAAPYNRVRHLDVLLNGEQVGRARVEGLQSLRVDGLRLRRGENVLAFRPDPSEGFDVPARVDPARAGQDNRALTVALLSLRLV